MVVVEFAYAVARETVITAAMTTEIANFLIFIIFSSRVEGGSEMIPPRARLMKLHIWSEASKLFVGMHLREEVRIITRTADNKNTAGHVRACVGITFDCISLDHTCRAETHLDTVASDIADRATAIHSVVGDGRIHAPVGDDARLLIASQ